ncbi:phenylalanine--tRNA ligase beta subunit-related protein [Halovibrio variabilis]|uniref:phenylalanine--tRNA ligase beta subunit-related protein n=1 Tax=Halovibrio variabilis TaxID=31910 RepID=UPI0011BDF2B7|nr:phenylalanine--tRNA ligase beta subunit-related protein [Halovibrio variabilis]
MINVRISESTKGANVFNPVICLVRKFQILPPDQSALDDDVSNIQAVISQTPVLLTRDEKSTFWKKTAHIKLRENVYKNGLRRHNNLVDAANIASLEYGTSIGLHDASSVVEDIIIEISSGKETIRPLYMDQFKQVAPYQLIYRTGNRLLAWVGELDVDSADFQVRDSTNSAMIVVLGSRSNAESDNRQICFRTLTLLRRSCPKAYGQIIPTIRETGPISPHII